MSKFFCYVAIIIFALQPISSHGEIRIIDADTIELNGAKIRLGGIDAPERSQTCENQNAVIYNCGKQATQALKELIAKIPDKTITCDYTDKDKYGRLVGSCRIGNININGWLVENGWALAYRQYSKEYVENEKIAKLNKAGIWNGRFVEPWNWRKGGRLNPKITSAKDGCSIKGNISSSGEKIYHVEGGQYYNRTKITPKKGERWFCSEGDAKKNGWRKSKR